MGFGDMVSVFIRFFFILTPFFVLAVFLALTEEVPDADRRSLAIRVTAGVAVISLVMLFFGDAIFAVFGITVDAFRIGAGALLFLSAVSLTQGNFQVPRGKRSVLDLAIVPLAMPVTLGPGAIGALLVMGSEADGPVAMLLTGVAVVAASLAVGAILLLNRQIKRLIGSSGISMLSKVTGLFLAALSSQMIFTGIKDFFK